MELIMASFDSPLGKKQIQGQPMKEFSVSDESGYVPPPPRVRHRDARAPAIDPGTMQDFQERMYNTAPAPQMREMSDVERDIMESKRAQREGKERLSDGAKRRIEILVGMTRLTKEVEVEGQRYVLQTLKSKELREALVATVEFDGSIQLVFETRKQLLARALTVVAGMDISQFLNSDDLQARLDFIEDMDHALLQRLYIEYVSLANEAQDKYSLKTPVEAKEVMDDLKK
jgi:hypothetical protein